MVLGLIANIMLFATVVSNLFWRYGSTKKGNYSYFFMVISVFLVTDRLFGFIFNIIPFTNFLRILFVSYVFFSKNAESSKIIYKFYLQPFLVTYEATFKFFIDFFRTKIGEYLDTTSRRTSERIRNVAPSLAQLSSLGSSVRSLTDQVIREQVQEEEAADESNLDESESSKHREE